MAVMDEFRKEREAVKNGTPKEKLSYFWNYYKWHVIVSVCVIVCIASFVYQLVTKNDTGLYCVFLNNWAVSEDNTEAYLQGFADFAGIDTSDYDIILDNSLYLNLDTYDENSYAAVQKIAVLIAASEIDVLAADQETYEYYAYMDYLIDLRTVLSEEQQAAYEPYFFYVDRKVVEAKDEANSNNEDYELPYPDPTQPQDMEDPVPVGILLDAASEEFSQSFAFSSTQAVIGIVCNTTRSEQASAFLDYVLGGE